jgi:hypothetical protein
MCNPSGAKDRVAGNCIRDGARVRLIAIVVVLVVLVIARPVTAGKASADI